MNSNPNPNPGAPRLDSETWVSTHLLEGQLPDDQLRHAFRAYATSLSVNHTPPPAAATFLRAERRRRRLAIERAERPLLVMQILGTLFATATIAWLAYRFAPHALPTLHPTYLALAIACTVLVLAGCAAMLQASRRPTS